MKHAGNRRNHTVGDRPWKDESGNGQWRDGLPYMPP